MKMWKISRAWNDKSIMRFCDEQQKHLANINLVDNLKVNEITKIAGVDLSYWKENNCEYAVCSIVIIDYLSKKVLEKVSSYDIITVPYMPGYLSFRELPLILKTYNMVQMKPELIIFDGNGYLHYKHMGIATHASFYLEKPTIGVAKNYLKVNNTDFVMPKNIAGSFTDIVINKEIYGRALRTKIDVKPIFVSCGNLISIETSTQIILNLVGKDSRQPLPTRLADIESRHQRGLIMKSDSIS